MYRSYCFSLFACAVFSVAALINAYFTLPDKGILAHPGAVELSEQAVPSTQDFSQDSNKASDPEAASAARAIMPAQPGSSSENIAVHTNSDTQALKDPCANLDSPARHSRQLSQITDTSTCADYEKPKTVPLNSQTDNFNILLLGVDRDKLEMVSVYSINHHLKTTPLKSVSLFFPTNSAFIYKGRKRGLEEIFASGGWESVAEVLEKEMYIGINYYVKIDRQALRDLEKYFDPIYVDGEKVEMETLFVRRTSNEDDRIIARILKQVLRPEVFFRYIPSLVFSIHRDIESNLSFSPRNLAFYYRIAKRLSTKRVEKIVLSGSTEWQDGNKVNIPPQEALACAIYRATQPK